MQQSICLPSHISYSLQQCRTSADFCLILRCLDFQLTKKPFMQTYIAGYPWPVTAPLGLYPEYSFDCLPHVDYGLRKAITEALFRFACC